MAPKLVARAKKEQRIAVQEDRADNTTENLCLALQHFLSQALQEAWTSMDGPRSGYATEQARAGYSAGYRAGIIEVCDRIVSAKIEEWSGQPENQTLYNEPALLKHKKMFDIMKNTKEGYAKENTFLRWCRKIAGLQIEVASTATEHAESSEERDPPWLKSLALDLLTNDLLPEQVEDEKYQIRRDEETGEILVTGKQRSWINLMLRKNLGHSKVAYFIFNHGIPELFDTQLTRKRVTEALLQNMLEHGMRWHASMLQSILEHENHPDMEQARQLSALDQGEWRQQRQERKHQAKQRMVQGNRLAMERDTNKRKFEDMSATEQQCLEDFDTEKSRKQYDEARASRPPIFRGSLK